MFSNQNTWAANLGELEPGETVRVKDGLPYAGFRARVVKMADHLYKLEFLDGPSAGKQLFGYARWELEKVS